MEKDNRRKANQTQFCAIAAASVAAAFSLLSTAQAQQRDPAQVARVAHVKELLGKHYKKVARSADSSREVKKFVEAMTVRSLPRKFRRQSPKLARAIMEEAARFGFDPIFLVSVIQTESSFNPLAKGTSGEIGLMQLKPNTGKWIAGEFGLKWKGAKTLADPVMNVRIGAAYLSRLREDFRADGRLYIPAYNMGPTAVRHSVAQKIVPADYAKRVMKKYLKNYRIIEASSALSRIQTRRLAATLTALE